MVNTVRDKVLDGLPGVREGLAMKEVRPALLYDFDVLCVTNKIPVRAEKTHRFFNLAFIQPLIITINVRNELSRQQWNMISPVSKMPLIFLVKKQANPPGILSFER